MPNWNGLHFLQTCFDSLLAQTHSPVEIIVVDNASEDGSQAFIREHYPTIRLLALDENRGFTGACNAGIQAAQGDIVVLLNNDTQVEPDWAEQIAAAFARHPDAGMVASKMLLFDRRDTLHTAGDFMRVNGLPGNRGVWQPDGPPFDREAYVFSACGGSAAYRRAMLDEVGLLDDDFFFSAEDVDLGWRAQLAGWRCVYVPQAVVYHHLSATGGGKTASYYNGRNFIWLIAKNYPGDLLRRHWRAVLAGQIGRAAEAIRAWRGESALATLRGMLTGLLTLPHVLRKRRQVQALRTVPLDYLDDLLCD
ncbi:MAG: glycosyltransferase family 2 protein [Anaerolineae bacterium]